MANIPAAWGYVGGQAFLTNSRRARKNPSLGIVNPGKKRRSKVAKRKPRRDSKGRFVKTSRKRNPANPRRKARVSSKRRSARKSTRRNSWPVGGRVVRSSRGRMQRNAKVLGVEIPGLEKVAWTGAGFLAPPMIEGALTRLVPAEWYASDLGRYAMKGGAVFAASWVARRFVGRAAGNWVTLGGMLYIGVSLLNDYVPQFMGGTAAPMAAAVASSAETMGRYVPLGSPGRRAMGEYVRPAGADPIIRRSVVPMRRQLAAPRGQDAYYRRR